MSAIELDAVYKRYPRSMAGWTALRRLWELFQPPRSIARVTPADLGDHRYIWALRGIRLAVERGEVVGLIGPNGSGKSSLLRIVAGITDPSAGAVSAAGRVGSLLEIGAGFHPEMTGRENIYLSGTLSGLSRREIDRHFHAIVEFSGLTEFIDLPVKKYSSGMFVRLGFSVATVVPPEILLVDEILSVGDLAFQRKSIQRMRELKHSDTTILFVSHNMDAVRHFCSRGVFLVDGQIEFDGPIDAAVVHYYRHADARHRNGPSELAATDHAKPTGVAAEIAATRITDDSGRELSELAPGQACILQIEYRVAGGRDGIGGRTDPAMHLGISLYDADGLLVLGFTSRDDGEALNIDAGRGTIAVRFPAGLPFARGTYRVVVRLLDADCLERFAVNEHAGSFRIGSPAAGIGWARAARMGEWRSV
jgi:ABC-type polysaccharide/polyol phosphate transport system ATPase subunit